MVLAVAQTRTCVDVAVFASVLGGDDRSHVGSAQRGEDADLPVESGYFLRVAHHLTTRSRHTHSTSR